LYANLSEVLVEVGQTVTAGSVIGLAGQTGNSFGGGFSHFSLYLDGATFSGQTIYPADIIDPTPFLLPLLQTG
jgi:murein DD-endopeptidase MepM/ murein hydrolase activator NlpD